MDHLCFCVLCFSCLKIAPVHCCLVATCWERASLLALVGDDFLYFSYFHMWYPGSGVVFDCIVS